MYSFLHYAGVVLIASAVGSDAQETPREEAGEAEFIEATFLVTGLH